MREVMEDVFMLVIVTLLSVLQNVSFANKVEKECKTANAKTAVYERVYCANRNCMDTYPTFIAVMWCAGICLSQAPAAFAGIMYLFVRQKYFVGYMGQTPQRYLSLSFGVGLSWEVKLARKLCLGTLYIQCTFIMHSLCIHRTFISSMQVHLNILTSLNSFNIH
uniref:Arachidonate 5-lipoxygenase-activating protein n=1 Tax=Paramormyrops kingsleyae TaxID=1676925 RepID=A0A3B3T6H3_9TELE